MFSEFDKIYDELSKLNEKWYQGDKDFKKFWFSENIIECQNFIEARATAQDVKALRFNFAPGYYAIANGLDLNHDVLGETVEELLYIKEPQKVERATAGFPKCIDFEAGNFESYLDFDDDDNYDDSDSLEYYEGELIADCGNFEVTLYNFVSDKIQRPANNPHRNYEKFEGSELEKVLKPFIKKLYIYHGKEIPND